MMGERHVTIGRRLGLGRTAEIFELPDQPGRVVKLFFEWVGRSEVEWESSLHVAVVGTGLPVPSVHGLASLGKRMGIIYDQAAGRSMMEVLLEQPHRLEELACQMADLHHRVNAVEIAGQVELPRQREILKRQIAGAEALSKADRAAVGSILEGLPDGDALCHGDFHPGNIILSGDEPVILDWPAASRGRALGDVARSVLLLTVYDLPSDLPEPVRQGVEAARGQFESAYRRRYFEAVGAGARGGQQAMKELQDWILVSAAARLSDGIAVEREALLLTVRRGLGPHHR